MGAISATDIISIIRSEIENYDWDMESRETGKVIWVGDGIATIYGIDHAMYGEIIVFENGVKGMVQDIRENEIGCILFGKDTGIKEGTKVTRTKKRAGIPVGDGFIGRVINALGEPIDGKGEIKEEGYRPVEEDAPGIIDRQPVDTPMETGILAIDSMFPIGRGQRELIRRPAWQNLSPCWKNTAPWITRSCSTPRPATRHLCSISLRMPAQLWASTLCTKEKMS